MDRKAWIAVSLSVVGLLGYFYYFTILHPAPPPRPVVKAPAAATPESSSATSPVATPASALPTAVENPTFSARSESLVSRDTDYLFSNDKGGIESAFLKLHTGENKQAIALNNKSSLPIGAIGLTPGQSLGGFEMKTDSGTGVVSFSRRGDDGLVIVKDFAVPPSSADSDKAYTVRLDVKFSNDSQTALTMPGYFVSTGGAAPIHSHDLPMYTRFDWLHDGHFSKIDVNWFNPGGVLGFQWSAAKSLFQESKEKTSWAAVTSQYFCTIVENPASRGTGVWATRFDTHRIDNVHAYGMQGGLNMPGFTLQPGETYTDSFDIYTGPKELSRLRKLGANQEAVLDFGWFGIISEFLLWGMTLLHSVLFGSYAAAIIVLTLIIKSCLWPIQNKATNEMRKMSLLTPKMTELREKYKDDPQKMNEETMKLYREYGVNPFSGCLPMLIQIPIFFGFYTMLGTAIELRNSSFLWITDLSQPDTIAHVLGFPINILPIIMAGTMVWQMAITPKTGDAMQQRIFYFMPIIFLVFCYNYASGLALYWTTQNLFSIVQLYLTRNKPLPTLVKKSTIAKQEAAAAARKKKKRP